MQCEFRRDMPMFSRKRAGPYFLHSSRAALKTAHKSKAYPELGGGTGTSVLGLFTLPKRFEKI